MEFKRLVIALIILLMAIISVSSYLVYSSFSSTVSTSPVTVNAYWLKTNIILGESVTFVVKAVNSNFAVQIWKEGVENEPVVQYQGSGILSQSFIPLEKGVYYIKVVLPDGSVWMQQKEYRLIVN
ncbi:MAG: hypothetical protein QXG36_07920 [Nitrososphaeria archaeon]